MKCEETLRAVAEAWGTPGPLPQEVRFHLAACDTCALEARRITETLDAVARAELTDPGEAYWEEFLPRLRRTLATRAGPARRGAFWWAGVPGLPGWPRFLLPAAAAATIAVAAGVWALWGPSGFRAPEADLTAMGRSVEEKMLHAGPGARERIADLFDPREAAEIAAAGLDLGSEEVLDAISGIEEILYPVEIGGLPDLEEMLQGLSRDQVEELLGEIGGADRNPAGGPAEVKAG